jgi:hypothetical protein
MVHRKEWEWIVSQFRSLLWLFVSCFLSTFASAGSERLTVAYQQWPPYKIVQNGTIGGIDTLVLDEIARRTGLEFDYVECPWARCLIMLQDGSVDMSGPNVRYEGTQTIMRSLRALRWSCAFCIGRLKGSIRGFCIGWPKGSIRALCIRSFRCAFR